MEFFVHFAVLICSLIPLAVLATDDANLTNICPKGCLNDKGNYIFECVDSQCSEFPANEIQYPDSVQHVDISFNFLSVVPILPLPEVKYLDLSNNQIAQIEKGAFEQCANLVHLNLSMNLLKEIHVGFNWKQPFPSLQAIDLSYNLITSIEEWSFSDMSALISLNLSSNSLDNLTFNTFDGLEELEILNLSNNSFKKIGTRFFRATENLQFLSLRKNKVQTIDNDAFQVVRDSLLRLDLGENHLEYITKSMFHAGARHPFSTLQAIHLDKNKLKIIESGTFSSIISLEYIFLDENHITEIGNNKPFPTSSKLINLSKNTKLSKIYNGTFSGLIALDEIDVTGCYKLHEIDSGAFDGQQSRLVSLKAGQAGLYSLSPNLLNWTRATNLSLEGNPWNCDCDMQWMQDSLPKSVQHTVSCTYPHHLKGLTVDTLRPQDMDCTVFSRYRHRLGIALICAFTVVFVVVSVYLVMTYRRNIFGPCTMPAAKGDYRTLYNAADEEQGDPEVNIQYDQEHSESTSLKNNPAPTPV